MLFVGDPGYEDSIVPRDWNNLAPRAGFAWQVRPRTVIRGAYGIFYDQFMGISNNRGASGFTMIRDSKSSPAENPRYSCVGRAKQ